MSKSPDTRLSKGLVVRGFISIISKVKMQEKIRKTEIQRLPHFPNILHVDADADADADVDADARSIAIALLH